MKYLKQVGGFSFMIGLMIWGLPAGVSMAPQGAQAASLSIGGLTIRVPTRRRYGSRGRSRSAGGSSCQSARWGVQVFGERQIATNNAGVMVTYDENGDVVVQLQLKSPLPAVPSNRLVPVMLDFGRYGTQNINGILDSSGNLILIRGLSAITVSGLMKSASRLKVSFINNTYCTKLRGSGNAVDQITNAAAFWKANKKDKIDDAREARLTREHAKRAETMAKTQKESSEKAIGIRPKGNLGGGRKERLTSVKIQYYVPGSTEIGEMWVDWKVDENRGPVLKLNFIDPKHKYDIKAEVIPVSLQPVTEACDKNIKNPPLETASPACKLVRALLIADNWGKIAQKKGLRRQFSKLVSYIEGDKDSRIASSVHFNLYENGAVSAQIEYRKFGYPKKFNFSMANALELARYIEDMRVDAAKGIVAGTMSEKELDNVFAMPN